VPLILGDKYLGADGLLCVTAWLLLPAFLAGFFIEISVAANHLWFPTVYTGVIMVLVVIGDFLLIPQFGAFGAVIAKLCSLSIGILVMMWLSRKQNYIRISDLSISLAKTFMAIAVSFGV